ncbi:hypothetical protein METBIDRAFT_36811 [Metschnikowia bicuspidata var. bicuspidata NRRL YB-4993]|uniref:Uncharacterized protein n=1 Tax=Metschnikowia bicuspidata var. bicuspidata NRRL YB-4993 TaxID=869754 RepID=A0A1A0HJH3_9ASCO|nr:hypothetical protein METBIDRAFT_36811 [Metschnikowia bicuspidata var. bicuspidata NRRL YB-4993]OBA24037.1 hypothetical protein METBIDRAFT_36811 [Metschnikowia bicuspidata var. bicuspidata NRRL YB-4993]
MEKAPGVSVFQTAYSTLKRPTTAAVSKMLHKLVAQYPQAPTKKKIGAVDLQRLIEKATKCQKKAMTSQQTLVEALTTWATDLPNEDVVTMMRDFTDLIENVGLAFATQADRLNSFKVKLGAIASREERQQFLLSIHENLQKQYNDTALKLGPQAQQSTLYLDQIEESEYNLKLIEQQLARTASVNLRAAITEYLTWLQGALIALNQKANTLAGQIREGDPTSPVRRSEMPNCDPSGTGFPLDSSKTSPLNMRPPENHSGLGSGKKDRSGSDARIETSLRDIAELLKREDFFASNVAREHDDLASGLRDKDTIYDIRNFEENREGWGMHS